MEIINLYIFLLFVLNILIHLSFCAEHAKSGIGINVSKNGLVFYNYVYGDFV